MDLDTIRKALGLTKCDDCLNSCRGSEKCKYKPSALTLWLLEKLKKEQEKIDEYKKNS